MSLIDLLTTRHANAVAALGGAVALTGYPMEDHQFHKAAREEMPDESVAVVNTGAVDLADEVVVPSGADWSYFQAFKSVLYCHDAADARLPVGRLRNLEFRKSPDRWVMRWSWGPNEFAQAVKLAVTEGVINGTSIGFIATERGTPTEPETNQYGDHRSIVRKWAGLEVSIVPHPCNPEAMIGAKSAPVLGDESIRALEAMVGRGKVSRKSAAMIGVPKRRCLLTKTILVV